MKVNSLNAPLFSIIVLTYRNFDYVFEALDSIFQQTYSNIELIVSDDGSPQFPINEIEQYTLNNKRENIRTVIINHECENIGTVRHFNKAISLAKGEFLLALAGDDILYDKNVIQTYMDDFSGESDEYLVHMAQTAMYDITLKNLYGYYCKPDVENALYDSDFDTLFERLCLFPCLPSTSTCFRKKFFEKYGLFDERYKLIEDYPMHLRIIAKKCRILYKNFIAIKHRHGGISHGGVGALSSTQCSYYTDLLRVYNEEILPNLAGVSEEVRIRVVDKIQSETLWIESMLYRSQGKYIKFILKHPLYSLKSFFARHSKKIVEWSQRSIFGAIGGLAILPFIDSVFISERYFENIQGLKVLFPPLLIAIIVVGGCLNFIGRMGDFIVRLEEFPSSSLYLN